MGKDIAGGETALGTFTPVQLFAGEAPIVTGDYECAINVVKYGVYALNTTGKVSTFNPAATDIAGVAAVIASQDGVTGDRIAFFEGGYFNHEALVWPAALTTYDARRAEFASTGTIKIGRLVN